MSIRTWYWIALGIWCVTGLPFYVLSEGFAGDDAFTLLGFLRSLNPPTSSWAAFSTWLVPTMIILCPLLLLPFAFSRTPRSEG
jgi:hypothetical protein